MATTKKSTAAEIAKFVPGKTKFKVTAAINGHQIPIGTVCTFLKSGGQNTAYIMAAEYPTWWVYSTEFVVIVSREEEADLLDAEIAELTKTIEAKKEEVIRLRKYKDANDELAHLISEAIKSDGSPTAIYALLTKFNINQ